MVTLRRGADGAYRARKRIPDEFRKEYGILYGRSLEEKFFAPATTSQHVAKQLFGDWLAQVEGQLTALRAQGAGEGITLSPRQAAGLAGEWYDWFLARHPLSDEEEWEELRDKIQSALKDASGEEDWEAERGKVWNNAEVREAVRPLLADVGETAQFLGMKGTALDRNSSIIFLDQMYLTLSQALERLLLLSRGDYSPDRYRGRLPKFEQGATNTGITPWALFEKWVAERAPAASTIESWRYPFREMQARFKDRSASSITPEEADAWITSLVTAKRSARTVKYNWLSAAKSVFVWAVDAKHVPRNPFTDVKRKPPKRRKKRESEAFEPHEYRPILKAALAIADTSAPDDAAKRWVPWLCAYTGARPGEITQLRGCDVIKREGINAIKITEEAGTTKSGPNTVPLHEHLLAQGFLKFVESKGAGPLFYKPSAKAKVSDPTKQPKPRASQTRQRLAAWVRTLGVNDPELSPNHAWRHTFKQLADANGISERMSDSITTHAPKTVGSTYGKAVLKQKAEALKKFPRYALGRK